MKNHLPVGVVWEEVATVLDTGLTVLRYTTIKDLLIIHTIQHLTIKAVS